jgi:HAD superfamily hydrolase (TIGR01509 family)
MPPPEDAYDMARAATMYITRRVRAAFPGVAEAIRLLHAEGHTLYTASGEPSDDLDGYLSGMHVRGCFTRLYGPDLVDTFKTGPTYYERIFADARVDPARALVVDDNADAVAWAWQAGAHAVHVTYLPAEANAIPSLAHVPSLLRCYEG